MKITAKLISFVLAFAFCAVLMTACADKGSDNAETSATSATTTQTEADNSVDPSEIVDPSAGITDKMYSRALTNEGDKARLASAMRKAASGEKVTVGVIGGSITQGSLASRSENCYASGFFRWWSEAFPNGDFEFINAGIGGTDSYLGVHRVDEQLLSKAPDVVIVEFSVNDTDPVLNKYSYDSLVRKILSADNSPAVILLFTTTDAGFNLQDVHMEIGSAYDLPMISYRDAVYPEIEAGTLLWKDISPDNIHPNDNGHRMITQLLGRYLDSVLEQLDSIDEAPSAFDMPGHTNDYYKNAELYNASQITAVSSEGFETGQNNLYSLFPDNWIAKEGGTIVFNAECRNFGIFFLRTTDGKSGAYEVYVDGEKKGTLDADFTGGWGSYGATKQVLFSKETAEHTIEIRPAAGSEDKALTILALMIS